MLRLFVHSLLTVTAFGGVVLSPAHAATSLIDLGSLGGGSTMPYSISADGLVVAGQSQNNLSESQAFIWKSGLMGQISLGGTNGYAPSISADGAVIVGQSVNNAGEYQAFRWENGVTEQLSLGGNMGSASGVSADGTVVIGQSANNVGEYQAFRWENGTIQQLSLGGSAGNAYGVSADGAVVVGQSRNALGQDHAFRWENGTIQQLSLGGANGVAMATSANGAVVVGQSANTMGESQAFRWENGVIQQLSLGGTSGLANNVSNNGAVVAGQSRNALGQDQAFRWENGAIQQLSLGGTYGGVIGMNADASVLVGVSRDTLDIEHAFRWTQGTGIQSLNTVLADAGVDITDWFLSIATDVSADGRIIVGTGSHNGNSVAFLANVETGGVTTPQDLSNSMQTIQQSGQQVAAVARNYAPNGLFIAQNMPQLSVPASAGGGVYGGQMGGGADSFANLSPASGGRAPSRLGAFLLGSVGIGHNNTSGNYQLNGTLGISMQLSDSWNIGAGMIAGRTRTDMNFNGDSRLDALGGMAMASYVPYESPLRIYGTAFAADLTLNNKRGYLNGSGLDYSRGGAGGLSYGGALRVGWEKELFSNQTTMMPYIEGRYSKTKMDGYSEQGGAFAASFSEQEDDYTASRLGLEFKHQLNEKTQLLFRPAWGHRFSGSGDGFTATTAGLTMGYAGQAGDRDWAEASVGASYRATEKLTFTTELTTRTGDTSEPLASVTIGAFMKF